MSYINLFYWIIIPLTIGALLIFIGSDVLQRVRRRSSKNKTTPES